MVYFDGAVCGFEGYCLDHIFSSPCDEEVVHDLVHSALILASAMIEYVFVVRGRDKAITADESRKWSRLLSTQPCIALSSSTKMEPSGSRYSLYPGCSSHKTLALAVIIRMRTS